MYSLTTYSEYPTVQCYSLYLTFYHDKSAHFYYLLFLFILSYLVGDVINIFMIPELISPLTFLDVLYCTGISIHISSGGCMSMNEVQTQGLYA